MKPYQIPLSTAKYDPKWFYNKYQGISYIDKQHKNVIINNLIIICYCC